MRRMSFGEKLQAFLDSYRRPDGSTWTNKDIEAATGGFVNVNYITNLKHDRIRQPGSERLAAIAHVMGFPEELWYRREEEFDAEIRRQSLEQQATSISEKLNFLFEYFSERRKKQRPLTNREVARQTLGELSEEEIAAIRGGKVDDLTGKQYQALSRVFGVDLSYWYARPGQIPPMDAEDMGSLGDERVREILHRLHGRSEEQKDLIISMLDQLPPTEDRGEREGESK